MAGSYGYPARGRSEQQVWQRSGVSDVYGDRADTRVDFPSYHRAATPPPGARGGYAPSPPRGYAYDQSGSDTHAQQSRYESAYSSYASPAAAPTSSTPSWSKRQGWVDRPTAGSVPRVRATQSSYQTTMGSLIPGSRADEYSIVFDLDETMCYARAGPARPRPGLQEVLNVVRSGCEVIVWTAGEKVYADSALRTLGASGIVRHVVSRDGRWYREGCSKDLSRLGRHLSRTLIIENTAQCIENNSDTAVLLPDFNGATHDSAMPVLAQVLSGLLSSGQTVQDYLRDCPLLTVRQVRANSSGKVFGAYTLRDHVPDDALERQQAAQPAYSYGSGYGAYNTPSYARPAQPYAQRHYAAPAYGAAYGQTA